jgi:HAE1 family hydrophobic/amphiphilic exporter-1
MASLLVAITFLPMMASKLPSTRLVKKQNSKQKKKRVNPISKLFDIWESFYRSVSKGYAKILRASLKKRKLVIIIAAIILILSLITVPTIGFEYFPAMDEGIISVDIELPKGSTLSDTHETAFKAQEIIKKIPEVEGISMIIGNSGSVLDRSKTEKATLSINVGSVEKRNRPVNQIANDIKNNLNSLAGAKIKVNDESRVMGFSIGYSEIDIRIMGDELEVLKEISRDLIGILKGIDGIRDIESSIDEEIEEILIRIDRDKALLYGLTTSQVGQAIRLAVNGIVSTRYEYRGKDIDVVVSSMGSNLVNLKDLENISIHSPRGVAVPLMELADISKEKSTPDILRNDQKNTVSITADLDGRAINKVTSDIDRAFAEYKFPSGCSYVYAGQQKDFIESFDELFDALILSIIIVYMLLAAQFESLIHPFTILLTVPLALTGALMALLITGNTLSIPAFIGMILLVGIVVDNAIVLIDSIKRFKKEGMNTTDAIVKSGPLRLRPILMTTLTTILGMLPMALTGKEGSEIQIPLAVVLIGGLAVSTLVTLIVIPSIYMTFERMSDKVKNE